MAQSDYQMALLLQRQFEHEANIDNPTHNLAYTNKKGNNNFNNSKSLTDPSWELIDPTPNIHVLFMAFNEKYFWNKLLSVCVDWSKRMTSCAGICSYHGRGGLCRVTLSEPLLKLRPRKDLIETLLHEMIHAYLFVTHNNRDRDGHGPEFHKHMYRINAEAGTNITVYHDFHDEVKLYQQHWWRCNGPCQTRKPYFGMVRRATNRAPGPYDRWFGEHQQNCGGTFIKVKEPEKAPKKKNQKQNKPAVSPKNDIRNFYPVLNNQHYSIHSDAGAGSSTSRVTGFKDLNSSKTKNALANSSSTIVINKKPSTKTKPDVEQTEKLVVPKSNSVSVFSGVGHVLGNRNASDNTDYAIVRNHWLKNFDKITTTKRSSSDNNNVPESSKKLKSNAVVDNKVETVDLVTSSDNSKTVKCPVCQKSLSLTEVNAHLDQCLENQERGSPKKNPANCPVCDQNVSADCFDKHVELCLNNVFSDSSDVEDFKSSQEVISCLVCDKQIPKRDLNAHLDECMGDNIFTNQSSVNEEINADTREEGDNFEKKYNCPVCFNLFNINEMSSHLDKCLVNDKEASENNILNSFLSGDF